MAEKLRVAFIDNSQAIDDQAIDAGEAKMTADKESLKGFSGFLKKIWKHNLARNYYRQKEINTARQQILESGNLFAAAEGSQDEFIAEQEAIVDRFMADHAEMIHQEAGESRRVIGETPEDKIFSDSLRNLIDKFVAGEINETELEEEKVRLLNSLPDFDDKNGRLKVGCADNLLAIAKQAKQSLNHQSGLAKLDYDLEIIVGRAVSGVRTEAKYNKVDRILEKLGKTKIGALINESTLGLAVAAATATAVSLGQTAGQMAARALGGLGLGALLTGGLAAMRESQELKRERKQHSREMAQGKRFKKDDVRRQEMEKFNYKTIKSVDILSGLEINFNEADTDNQAEIKQVVTNLADLEARIRLSDQQKIDLIAFSNLTNVEQERLELDLARARLKVTLRRLADHDKLNFVDGNLDDYLNSLIEAKKQELLGGDNGIAEKDRLFNKMHKARMVSTGINAAGIGFAVGLAFQEAASFFRSDQQGLIEGAIKGRQPTSGHQSVTLLEKARAMIFGQPKLQQAQELVRIGDHQFKVPVGTEIRPEADGEFSIFSGGKKLIGDLRLTNGQLSAESQADLAKHGINWLTQENRVAGSLGAQEVIEQNKKNFTNIVRRLWYDNDTKSFDKNELRVFWGGKYGSGLDQDGNILLNMQKMAPDGSYHTLAGQKLSADAQQLIKNGGLKLLLSLSKGTQNQVIEIPINSDGLAVIPKGSLAASLFSHANGVTKFTGQFMEVAQTMGSVENGAEAVRILATQVGQGMPDGSTIINEIVHSIDIPAVTTWEVPPIIPIMGRRPLEPAIVEQFIKYNGYHSQELSKEEKTSYEKYFSPRLKNDPQAKLEQQQELDWFFEQKQTREPEHFNNINQVVEADQLLSNLPKDTKLMVCMAVGAAYESENIYRTLKLYSKQDKAVLAKTVFVLNVNWFDDDKNDPDKLQKIQKTIAEINKIKSEFPQLQIAAFNQEYIREVMIKERGANIHGQFIKDVHDVALRSIQLSGINGDIFMLSNDADCKGMSDNYLAKMLDEIENKPEKDAFLGRIEWDTERWADHPGFHLSVRFMQFLDVVCRYPSGDQPRHIPTSGANSMIKASMLAAIGGVDPENNIGAGADVNLGRRVKYARGSDGQEAIDYVHGAWLDTNGDRAFNYYAHGRSVVEMWSDFNQGGYKGRGEEGFGQPGRSEYKRENSANEIGPQLRKDENGNFVAENIDKDWNEIIKRFECQINGGLTAYFGYDLKSWQRVLNFTFGNVRPARWTIKNNRVEITAAGNEWLKQQVIDFQANSRQDILYKRGGQRG
jgi:hypothetical protein